MRPRARHRYSVLTWLLAGVLVLPTIVSAQTGTAEGLILTAARAQDLARQTLSESAVSIGTLLNYIGPASTYASGEQGFGHWSASLGVSAAEYSVTSPDYTVPDPSGADRIEGGIGSANLDLSLGLFQGWQPSPSVTSTGSIDLLLRLGFSLGDQENLAEEVDTSSWAPVFGAGLRIGLLKGPKVPSVSLSMGANYFERRLFTVDVEEEDASVNLDFEQTTAFLLLEVGRSFGWITPYLAGGLNHNRLQADYVADVIYGTGENSTAIVTDSVDDKESVGVFYGGFELGSGLFRFALEAGASDGEAFGRFFFRFTG